jgi:DNA polymerase III subunit gamma/tau
MAYEPLHHKYRPQSFAELVGQEAIAKTLTNALRQQKIAPAYLFTGARGTGKTSSARILAKSLNCIKLGQPTESPCGVCEVCRSIANGSALDVIEIDAASNTGVDNIRELIERAQFAPVQCRYKVYVIDECHMLSNQAFNALLKTLEEPPDRVVFVLATTDPQRVLPTIISRCQRFDFRRIELGAMVRHLGQIADQEAIEISPEALQLVGQLAQGGLRDAQSTLDQLSLLEGQITPERVWELVGAVPEQDLLALVQAIAASDSTAVIDRVRQLMDRGREPLIVLQNLAGFYRDLLIAKTSPDRHDLVALTGPTWSEMGRFVQTIALTDLLRGQQHLRACEVQVKNTTQPRLWLEVTLLGLLPLASEPPASQPLSQPRSQPLPSFQPTSAVSPVTPPDVPPVAPPAVPLRPQPTVEPVSQPADQPRPEQESLKDERADSTQNGLGHPPSNEALDYNTAAQSDLDPDPDLAADPADQPELIPPVEVPDEIDLEQTWQEILGLTQPPGTRELFKQQGRLLELTDSSARIGITSKPLFKMAQMRLANLEAACSQLNGQPMKVSLEVLTIATVPNTPSSTSDTAQPPHSSGNPAQRAGQPPGRRLKPSDPPPTSVAETSNSYPQVVPASPNSSPSASVGPSNPPVPQAGSVAPPSYPAQPWQTEDEVKRAAKSLAQMFNGQIVNSDEPATGEGLKLESAGLDAAGLDPAADLADLEDAEGDPDADVPF